MIDIKIEDAQKKQLKDIPILFKNAPSANYDVRAADGETGTMAVTLIGAKAQIESINKNDITIEADFSSVTKPGVYDIPLTVTGTNKLVTYELASQTVKLEFKSKE